MISSVIAWCARRRGLTLAAVAAAAAAGLFALLRTPLDALPDLSETQVIVSTEWAGHSSDLIEDQITYPLVTALRAAAGVRYVRGLSMTGDSFVYVVFDEGIPSDRARSRVAELLAGE